MAPSDPTQQQPSGSASAKRKRVPSGKAARRRGTVVAAASKDEERQQVRSRVDEVLASPLSAFALFAFAQRAAVKRGKPSITVRELVKTVGERWLLLSEEEQRGYHDMARTGAAMGPMVAFGADLSPQGTPLVATPENKAETPRGAERGQQQRDEGATGRGAVGVISDVEACKEMLL
uniref:HMG box domain-containing protein n=1 Tax=Emiliania huxleyi TaxID=2903 RepID=A0A6V2Y8I2_EMIHU|mmetsp:Transcript_22038/g.64898  ORF Transcript_22038/g.64898 Transcript_22038/m.64898 type:complete len:177 (-) Transcript_22038:71-601(-)